MQKISGKKLVDNNLINKILLSKKIFEEFIVLLGPDIEYNDFAELSFNDKMQ